LSLHQQAAEKSMCLVALNHLASANHPMYASPSISRASHLDLFEQLKEFFSAT
jgi:hypothetical protein